MAVLGKAINDVEANKQKAYATAGARADEALSNIRTVQAMNGQAREEMRYRLELEAGAEWVSQKLDEENNDTSSYFVSLGYRYDF